MTVPAIAGPISATVIGNAPLTIAVGAAAFAILAIAALKQRAREGREAQHEAAGQIAGLRAQLDEYEAVLTGAREVTVLWDGPGTRRRIFGQTALLLAPGRRPESILDFSQWLPAADGNRLAQAVEGLRVRGEDFALSLQARNGEPVRASGCADRRRRRAPYPARRRSRLALPRLDPLAPGPRTCSKACRSRPICATPTGASPTPIPPT